ncbi:MAG TPA: HAMP domain-containing protein [Candidatus Polarisedimenticolia bacterium]|nr:HAMP domain-containing protein [Candidatus Polarisedimenticolia bacterium]
MPVTGLSLFYLNGILDDVQSITEIDAQIVETTRSIAARLDEVAENEVAYVLLRDESYLEQSRRAMDEIAQTPLEGLPHLGGQDTGYGAVRDLAAEYNLTLTRLADLYAGPAAGPEAIPELEQNLARIADRLRALKERSVSERDPQARRHVLELMRHTTTSLAETLVETAQERDPDRARILQDLIRIRERIGAIAHDIEERAAAHVEEHRGHVDVLSNRARRNLLTTILLTGIVCISLVLYLPSRVVRSLRRITHVLQQAERGDLDVATLETGRDEVGSLAVHLNRVLRHLRTFDELKSERMLRAEQRLETLVENLETGIVLVDDQMHPSFVSDQARDLLGSPPEGADDARIAGLLVEEDFSELLKAALSAQARQDPRVVDLDMGGSETRRLRIWADPILTATGEVREILLLVRGTGK